MSHSSPYIIDANQLIDRSLQDVEAFRADAVDAAEAYTPRDRALIAQLEAKDITAADVLVIWQADVQSTYTFLQNKRSEAHLRKLLAKHLATTEDDAKSKISQLIDARQNYLLSTFLNKCYPANKGGYIKQRTHAQELFTRPTGEVTRLKARFDTYCAYQRIAQEQHIIIIDPHTSWVTRMLGAWRLRSERKNIIASEEDRLQAIKARLEELANLHNGLLIDIVEKGWDLALVLSLRNQYEKQLAKPTQRKPLTAMRRLTIFEEVTRAFRDEHTEKLARESGLQSLEATRKIAQSIDTLLLRLFDLSTVQKNQLVLKMKEYRELTQEQAVILSTRDQRLETLQKAAA